MAITDRLGEHAERSGRPAVQGTRRTQRAVFGAVALKGFDGGFHAGSRDVSTGPTVHVLRKTFEFGEVGISGTRTRRQAGRHKDPIDEMGPVILGHLFERRGRSPLPARRKNHRPKQARPARGAQFAREGKVARGDRLPKVAGAPEAAGELAHALGERIRGVELHDGAERPRHRQRCTAQPCAGLAVEAIEVELVREDIEQR